MIEHINTVSSNPSRVVILGVTGFVGSEVRKQFERTGIEFLGLGSKDIDLTRGESVQQLKEVVQPEDSLLFISALTPDKGRDVRTMMSNLLMSQHVAEFLNEKSCAHLVYVSSDAVYGDSDVPIGEQFPCDPPSFHGIMHITREKILKDAAASAGIPLACLRPSAIFGAGDTHNGYGPNRFFRQAMSEKSIPLFGGGEEKRDHIYSSDVCELIQLTLQHRSQGCLNVVTGQSVSFHEGAERVAQVVGENVQIEPSERKNPITHVYYDAAAVLKAFPNFSFTPFERGIEQTYAALTEQ